MRQRPVRAKATPQGGRDNRKIGRRTTLCLEGKILSSARFSPSSPVRHIGIRTGCQQELLETPYLLLGYGPLLSEFPLDSAGAALRSKSAPPVAALSLNLFPVDFAEHRIAAPEATEPTIRLCSIVLFLLAVLVPINIW